MLVNGERALAYVVTVDEVREIEGADNIQLALVGGWNLIVKRDEFKAGDKGVFFEIDSKLPADDERFSFLEKKGYKIKTMKLNKFGVYSQGLLLPLSDFPELGDIAVGTDLTKTLRVTYAEVEDNQRKGTGGDPNAKYKSMASRHQKIFQTKPVRWLMRRSWGRKLMFLIFGNKKDKPRGFPSFVSKTDEERVENQPWRVGDGKTYLATEKLDGTSCTYALERKPKKPFGKEKCEFYVCSRNIRQKDENQKCYHDHNIYWDLAFKYDIEQHLKDFLSERPDCKWVCIQGEGVGSVQKNPLKLKEDDLYVFNFITDVDGRWNSEAGKRLIEEKFGMKWVPILGERILPDTMEELKEAADGPSAVNPDVMREGIVYRSLDGQDSFKNVSRKYLLKHNG